MTKPRSSAADVSMPALLRHSRLAYSSAIRTLVQLLQWPWLTLEHAGFRGLRGLLVSSILGKGWRSKILSVNLPMLLARWTGSGPIQTTLKADCHRN